MPVGKAKSIICALMIKKSTDFTRIFIIFQANALNIYQLMT